MDYNSRMMLADASVISKAMQGSDNVFVINLGKALAKMDVNDVLSFRKKWPRLWNEYWSKSIEANK